MTKSSKLVLTLATSIWLTWCWATFQNKNEIYDFSDSISNQVLDSIWREWYWAISNRLDFIWVELNNKSVESIWKKEVSFFYDYFNIKNEEDFNLRVERIQKNFWLEVDWTIWPKTLKIIYLNFYSKLGKSRLPFDISKRLDIYNEMEWYKTHPWKISKYWKLNPSKVPDIFSKNYFYWIWKSENIKWTYINEKLWSFVNKKLNEWWNNAVLLETKDWFIVAVYVDGELELSSYISPWDSEIKWWIRTIKWVYNTRKSNKYHISWAKDSIKKTDNWLEWAVMPYALHVYWWIFAHAWYVTWERRSHWCIRLPIFYAKWLYDIYKKNWKIKWHILGN